MKNSYQRVRMYTQGSSPGEVPCLRRPASKFVEQADGMSRSRHVGVARRARHHQRFALNFAECGSRHVSTMAVSQSAVPRDRRFLGKSRL